MADNQTINELNRLIRVCLDGEAGFLVVAESVRNRGLKALFKTFAQQRAQFAEQLQAEVKKLGGSPLTEGSTTASLHRGWINIKTAMTIGQFGTENVALEESERGERTAVRTYERALATNLSDGVKDLVKSQHMAIEAVYNQIQQMSDGSGNRMVVRLFNEEAVADAAVDALTKAGFSADNIQKIDVGEVISIYEEHGARSAATESAAAGAFGGTLLGAVLGLIFGLATLIVPQINMMGDMGEIPAFLIVILLGAGIGAAFGLIFGALIGRGTTEEDTYIYAESVEAGDVLLTVETSSKMAKEASEIMLQINAARK